MVMTVELKPGGGTLEVAGRLAGSEQRWIWRTEVPAQPQSAVELPVGALHGKETIRDLEMMGVARPSEWAELNSRIEKIAMRHRIVSRRTSLVAVAEEPSVDARAARRRERLAIEVPSGMSAESLGLKRYPSAVVKWAYSREVGIGLSEDSLRLLTPKGPISAMIDQAAAAFRKPTPQRDLRSGPRGWVKGRFTGGAHPEIVLLGTVVESLVDGLIVEFEVAFEGF